MLAPLLLLAPTVLANEPPAPPWVPDIPMAAVHAAIDGRAPSPHVRVLEPPPQLLLSPGPPPPFPDKQLYGGRMDHHVDSTNFTVAWAEGDATQVDGELASQALEAAWQALVEEQAWQPPASSDTYMLWVILDPSLGGTGLTTEYTSPDFPDGYPVMFLNPTYTYDTDFFESLSAHEFSHALQFALRDWAGSASDAWYWEASAEWMAELARPELDVYAWSAAHYSSHPWYRFDSVDDYHQYGMCVLNAYVEEHLTGDGGVRAVWELSAERTGNSWDEVLVEALGVSAGDVWGGFTGAMGNQLLGESSFYEPVLSDGYAEDGLEGEVAMLGTDYFEILQDATVTVVATVEGEKVLISGPGEWGTTLNMGAGEVLGVTGVTEPTADYRLTVEPSTVERDTGDTGDPDKPEEPGGCACGGGVGGTFWVGLLALGWTRRRSGAPLTRTSSSW